MRHSTKVLRDGTKLLSSQGIITLSSIVFMVFLVRILTKTEMATFAIFSIIAGLINMSAEFGLATTCIKEIPELVAKNKHKQALSMIKTAFLNHIVFSSIFSLMTFIFSDKISLIFLKTYDYASIIKIMSLGFFFASLFNFLGLIMRAVQKFGKISLTSIIMNISQRVLSILLFFAIGLKGYIIGFAWGYFIGVILYVFYLKDWLVVRTVLYPYRKLVTFSFPYYCSNFVRYALMHVDQFIIGVLLEPTYLATYFVARKFMGYLNTIIDALMGPIVPKISELKKEGSNRIKRVFKKTSRYTSFIFIPLCFGVASLSYPLLHLYGGAKYTDAWLILSILSLSMVAYAIFSLFNIHVYILGKPIERLKIAALGGSLNILLGVILIYPFKTIGMAVAKFFVFSTTVIYAMFILKKLIDFKFDKDAMKQALFASSIMSLLIIIPQLVYYNLLIIPLYIAVGILGFMFAFCPKLERDDIKLIDDFLPNKLKVLTNILYLFVRRELKQKLAINQKIGQ